MELTRAERAARIREETIAGVVARLFQMLVDIYGATELNSLEKVVGKREGQEVALTFLALNHTITFHLSKTRLVPHVGKSNKAVAEVILAMKREDLIPSFIKFIRTKNSLGGVIKSIFKYYLTRKIRVKGSLGAGITLWRLLFIGKAEMYKEI